MVIHFVVTFDRCDLTIDNLLDNNCFHLELVLTEQDSKLHHIAVPTAQTKFR